MAFFNGAYRAAGHILPVVAAICAAFVGFVAAVQEPPLRRGVETVFTFRGEPARPALEGIGEPPGSGWDAQVIEIEKDPGSTHALWPSQSAMPPVRPETMAETHKVTLDANVYGHFTVAADINGMPVELMTDTGATYVALSYETVLSLGFLPEDLHFTSQSDTANGVAMVAPIILDEIRIGGIVVRDVHAVVTEPGKLNQNLLGMSFINRLSRFEVARRKLTLTQ
jgi:clan AA aspartic protease (TIGR02281 family)